VLQQPSRGIGDPDLLAQLHSGNPFLVLAHTIDRPEPRGEGNPGLVKNGSCGHRTLVPTGGAFFHPPTRYIASTAPPTAGTQETVRPALPGQVARTLVLVAEARAKFLYRQDSSSFQPVRRFHAGYYRLVNLDIHQTILFHRGLLIMFHSGLRDQPQSFSLGVVAHCAGRIKVHR
jgi:hypothetical protein